MYIYAVCAVLSHVLRLFVTLWIIAHQAPLSMGFSRQEYWSGLFCPPPGDLSHPVIQSCGSCIAGGFFTTEPSKKPYIYIYIYMVTESLCCTLKLRQHCINKLTILQFKIFKKSNRTFPAIKENSKKELSSMGMLDP